MKRILDAVLFLGAIANIILAVAGIDWPTASRLPFRIIGVAAIWLAVSLAAGRLLADSVTSRRMRLASLLGMALASVGFTSVLTQHIVYRQAGQLTFAATTQAEYPVHALRLLEDLAPDLKRTPYVQLLMGAAYHTNDSREVALGLFEEGIDETDIALYNSAVVTRELQRYQQSIRRWNRYIAKNSWDPGAEYELGVTFQMNEQPDSALAHYLPASVKESPLQASALFNIATCYAERFRKYHDERDVDEAIKNLNECLEHSDVRRRRVENIIDSSTKGEKPRPPYDNLVPLMSSEVYAEWLKKLIEEERPTL